MFLSSGFPWFISAWRGQFCTESTTEAVGSSVNYCASLADSLACSEPNPRGWPQQCGAKALLSSCILFRRVSETWVFTHGLLEVCKRFANNSRFQYFVPSPGESTKTDALRYRSCKLTSEFLLLTPVLDFTLLPLSGSSSYAAELSYGWPKFRIQVACLD